ncbi:MAG: glycosyltransferase [Chloroflexi bacterium]|nr:glycosyltransferase [Chloroflexota bacterium]
MLAILLLGMVVGCGVQGEGMSAPLITIGITCFKEGDWLLECWESVLAQTDERWTAVLVMDGGASVRTQEVFESLSHLKLRKYAFTEHKGPYAARNKAFELTETPYHFYLDGDDLLPPDAVQLVLDAFDRYPEAGYVYGDFQVFGARNGLWSFGPKYSAEDLIGGDHPPGSCAYKKAVWEQLGGFCDELADGMADYDFFIGAAERGISGHHCGRILCHYRVGHQGKVSGSYRSRYHEKCEIIIRRHPSFFADPERRRKFMGMGYSISANVCFHAGDYIHALEYAKRAAEFGETEVLLRVQRNWRYRVPPWLVPFGNSAIRLARLVGVLH